MAEEKNKKNEELQEEQLETVDGGSPTFGPNPFRKVEGNLPK